MIGKFADPDEDLMPWVEMTNSVHRTNDRHRPGNEKDEKKRITLSNRKVYHVEGVEG